ncbi:SDR family NAD(P)-dependent oxidoreductase [Paenibacillus sp. 1011MAR3C5]|uniref:SDR family NAD(P)-dependent oxidoreductase n=1 Tax=Paenibacillus sp. 1011MAR3C5 TaxID=1675787 RepID=UPI000E6BBAB8|nr:SDR family NAD(P)-dependent oxidoreductase [Paenibacillus sp. 1011MAR3C5]RJE86981.1 SDR family NAD(P)-dependent oxidoreductase [Paenibacillus sp. 1011MAR3C5]
MKKAIVIGATGGTGAAITEELAKQGIPTIAFGRMRKKLDELSARIGEYANLSFAEGDALKPEDIIAAAQDADVLFHCANVPYNVMESKLIPLGEAIMEAANRLGINIVAIDGIYPYGRRQTDRVDENHPKEPHTRKGKTRLQFEHMLFDRGRWSRSNVIIARLPDYYGPTANAASYLGSTLEAIAAGKMAFFIGNMRTPREYVYLPDAAAMIVELAKHDHAYGQNWNIPGTGLISGRDIVRIAQQASGNSKAVIPLGRIGLSLIGMGVPVMKEIVEMLYLTEDPVVLSGKKYEQHIGPIRKTAFEQGIAATIKSLQTP